ncbi:uncharacterized protein DUF3359 [Plasticicumulans lactativorans]|uniref:Uncharacterized protein DUF3359 n=1 Tax=Plasticicumulans lactativorans TaxID=1133106 RepID=A0A4R2KWC9_9GAMM|nr:alanine-zipper protein [Plasticicumulans lactativorans]TCO78183.1 uncharacterized protein DUF3359 [Plasticicumulans lactativorans]
MKNLLKLSALAAVAVLTVGCASTDSVEKAQATANQALDVANRANATANEAKALAADTNEKLNRVFKKSMYK